MRLVLGLGSNLGNRENHLRQAVHALARRKIITNLRLSSLYETPALLPSGAPKSWDISYYNIAVSGDCVLSPQEVLSAVKSVEVELGRKQRERWAPREIDIDILAYGDSVFKSDTLSIPHPELLKRSFAFHPLLEIEPDWHFPNEFLLQNADSRRSPLTPLRTFKLSPRLMGILNITPDSFSDGGKHLYPSDALKQAEAMIQAGAEILDLGAESTRPGATPLSWQEEWARLEPVLTLFKKRSLKAVLSIDTRHPETAERALEFGIEILNDVSGLKAPEMQSLAAHSRADFVFMHSLSIPADKTVTLPLDCDPVEEVLSWAHKRIIELEAHGIARSRLIFDPGIGFGKSAEQSVALIKGANRFQELGVRVLLGISRKSFFSKFTAIPFSDRDTESVAASLFLNTGFSLDLLRVHNVEMHTRALGTYEQLVLS